MTKLSLKGCVFKFTIVSMICCGFIGSAVAEGKKAAKRSPASIHFNAGIDDAQLGESMKACLDLKSPKSVLVNAFEGACMHWAKSTLTAGDRSADVVQSGADGSVVVWVKAFCADPAPAPKRDQQPSVYMIVAEVSANGQMSMELQQSAWSNRSSQIDLVGSLPSVTSTAPRKAGFDAIGRPVKTLEKMYDVDVVERGDGSFVNKKTKVKTALAIDAKKYLSCLSDELRRAGN